MSRTPYPSDLTGAQWELIAPLIPPAKPGGRPRTVDMREILNGIQFILRGGCAWRMLPHDLPPWPTVHDYYQKWRKDGTWLKIHAALREQVRLGTGHEATPSATILDSQSVKTTNQGGTNAATTLVRK